MYLIEILHQTTTLLWVCCNLKGCILSKFYIKPQLARQWLLVPCVVSYRNSTSNHNSRSSPYFGTAVVSYRNSTSNHNLPGCVNARLEVVSYRNSTSNHNYSSIKPGLKSLYLIEILHQTTTIGMIHFNEDLLYLIEILHQTTTSIHPFKQLFCCILSKFYIKPQPTGDYCFRKFGCILSKFYIKPQLSTNQGRER